MLNNEVDEQAIAEKLESIQRATLATQEMVTALLADRDTIGDVWVSQETAERITGLKHSRLYHLRKTGVIRSSTISGRKVFYHKDDFAKLLNDNMRKI